MTSMTSMTSDFADTRLSGIASAIAEPARTRMLCCLMDGHAPAPNWRWWDR